MYLAEWEHAQAGLDESVEMCAKARKSAMALSDLAARLAARIKFVIQPYIQYQKVKELVLECTLITLIGSLFGAT
jgi:hypothetical protein